MSPTRRSFLGFLAAIPLLPVASLARRFGIEQEPLYHLVEADTPDGFVAYPGVKVREAQFEIDARDLIKGQFDYDPNAFFEGRWEPAATEAIGDGRLLDVGDYFEMEGGIYRVTGVDSNRHVVFADDWAGRQHAIDGSVPVNKPGRMLNDERFERFIGFDFSAHDDEGFHSVAAVVERGTTKVYIDGEPTDNFEVEEHPGGGRTIRLCGGDQEFMAFGNVIISA